MPINPCSEICIKENKNKNKLTLKNKRERERKTSMMFNVALSKAGRALLPTCTSPSVNKCSYQISVFGSSIPTLHTNSKTKTCNLHIYKYHKRRFLFKNRKIKNKNSYLVLARVRPLS